MTRGVEPDELTDDEVVARLREAVRDVQEGRLVHCDTEEELRAFFASLRTRAQDLPGCPPLPAS